MRRKLRVAHYEQLLCYVRQWDGSYYGNRMQFVKRHEQIEKFLEETIAEMTKSVTSEDAKS